MAPARQPSRRETVITGQSLSGIKVQLLQVGSGHDVSGINLTLWQVAFRDKARPTGAGVREGAGPFSCALRCLNIFAYDMDLLFVDFREEATGRSGGEACSRFNLSRIGRVGEILGPARRNIERPPCSGGLSLLHDLGHGRLTDPPGSTALSGPRYHDRRGCSRPRPG